MSITHPTIMVVADRDDRDLVSRTLATVNYEVLHAESADDAILQVDRPIDLIVCDLCVRGQSCHALMRRWHERRPTTPFVLLAGAGEIADAIEAMKHGAADYVTKPVNGDELLVRVVKWLETSRRDERLLQLESRLDRSPAEESGNGSGIDIPVGTSLEDLERAAVEKALEQHRGNRTHAARTLGISVRTLQRKLKAWHVPVFALRDRPPSSREFSLPLMR
jgi:DNA-binding NtrC family response regulator